ncbi:MAG: IS1595 family transposase [Acidobacteriota bacterium]|nr:IS1595 family transposase [Acidobacteriota bacterium]
MKKPVTLQQAITYFSDADRAFDYAKFLRWPDDKVTCPRCGSDSNSFVKTRKLWFCNGCKKQFTVKVGTIFEDSPIGLDKWMTAVWMVCNCKNGISSYELHRSIGVTQKSAWFMLHRIREAMKSGSFVKMGGPEGGPCEVDETFIGGRIKNMHRSKVRSKYLGQPVHAAATKAVVMGMRDRETRQVRAKVVPTVSREVLQDEILRNIEKKSTIYTDAGSGYYNLAQKDFVHDVVNHTQEYVRGLVHTNGIENFWSLLKRGLKGTYVAVEPFHLDRYVTEQVFRFNNMATKDNPLTDEDRFALAMTQAVGRRLTYAQLTANGAD